MSVFVHKAQATGDQVIPDLLIEGSAEFPPVGSRVGVDLHQADADRIVDALLASLPGGTIDRLVATLLQRQASRLRVPHRRPEVEP